VQGIRSIGIVLVYFNLATFLAISYLKIYAINPRPGQSEHSWKRYVKSQQFNDFRNLHERLSLHPWYKRNFSLIYSLHTSLIVLAYFWDALFMYLVILIEFSLLFLIFTIRPFYEEFYMNIKVISRVLFLTEYLFIVLGKLYYSMGTVTFNYHSVTSFIIARDAIFLCLVFGIVIVIVFEIYFKCSNLNYQIKVVREANQYRLEFVDNRRGDTTDSNSKRHHTFSERRSKSSSHVPDFVNSPPKEHLRKELLGGETRRKSRSKVEIEMVSLKDTDKGKVSGNPLQFPRERSGSEQHSRKWKKDSTFVSMDEKKD
jgi:hypothetical protein